MKYLILFVLSLYTISAYSADFTISSFEFDPKDETAVNSDLKQIDVNGNVCAIVKVLTELEDMSFESTLLEKVINAGDGEYWVYLPGNTKRLKLKKEGVIPLTYEFPQKLDAGKVYVLEVKAEGLQGKIENIASTFEVYPKNAKLFVDEKETDKIDQVSLALGEHQIKLVQEGYKTIDEKINVTTENTFFNFQMQKEWKIDMVLVEGGSFNMGSEDNDNKDEKPVHSVILDDFYIGKFEITQEQWRIVMGNNPSENKGDHNPVDNISWVKAAEFCNKLSELEGLQKCYSMKFNERCDFNVNGYRLPTEAEWEYAARGGNKSKGYLYSGSDNLREVAEYSNNNNIASKRVGGKNPNELGIYDMSGNVYEWCWDWKDVISLDYYKTCYNLGTVGNPTGPYESGRKVIRGGAFTSYPHNCRNTDRRDSSPYFGEGGCGFRIARKP